MKNTKQITVEMDAYRTCIQATMPLLNERQRRLFLANQSQMLGRGGTTLLSNITGVDRNTISAGIKELNESKENDPASTNYMKIRNVSGTTIEGKQRIRDVGAGRKSIEEKQPGIVDVLLDIIRRQNNYGDPEGHVIEWISQSTRNLSDELAKKGFSASHTMVSTLLREQGYSLQENKKMKQVGNSHPDRDAQFRNIDATATAYISTDIPVISIDCKKKENIGEFKNDGKTYQEKGKPVLVLDHDFPLPEKGKAAPYGIYDIAKNQGFVNVGISADTAQFAVESIRRWWNEMGKASYPNASLLYITADGGGSNGSRCRLWKVELSKLSSEMGIPIEVSHFPPGTSKWNKIEHRMFSYITKNWRGQPLVTMAVIISLISATKTRTGLTIKCMPDGTHYDRGLKVSDEELQGLNIVHSDFHPEWNYTVFPI